MRSHRSSEALWTALLGAALVLVAALLLVAAPLADLLPAVHLERFFATVRPEVDPKHAETVRYLLAVVAAILTAALLARRPAMLSRAGDRLLHCAAVAGRLVLAGVVIWALLSQYRGALNQQFPRAHFGPIALAAAPVLAAGLCFLARRRPRWIWAADGGHSRWIFIAAAVALTVCWLAPDFYRNQNLAGTLSAHNVLFTFNDDFLPVLNGRTPLVNYDPQYVSLLGFAGEPILQLLGPKIGTFTALMCLLSLCAFIAVQRTLALVIRSERMALALFVPFLAISLQTLLQRGVDRENFGSYYAVFPFRYLGPYLLLYLCARQLAGRRPSSRRLIFLVAGLVALNNLEFGLPALAGAIAAMACTSERGGLASLRSMAFDLAAGVAGACVAVSALTLIRSGELPQFGRLTRYPSLYGLSGFLDIPTPTAGLYLILYVTFAGALVLVAQRVRERSADRAYTGALAYSAVFGLGAGSYYMGRSHPDVLVAIYSAWALCIALLAAPALRAVAERRARSLAVLGPLVLLGLIATRIVQFPLPWTQLHRIESNAPGLPPDRSQASRFVRRTSRSGEPVVILDSLGFLTARKAGVVDITPYSQPEAIVTYEQLDDVIAALRRAHGTRIYLGSYVDDPSNTIAIYRELAATLARRGFSAVAHDPSSHLTEWAVAVMSARAPWARRKAPSR